MLTLESLPAELLYSIHLYSLSSSLPSVSKHLHHIFTTTSTHYRATYLTLSHPRKTLQHSILYPLCTLPVLLSLQLIAKSRKKILTCPQLPHRLFAVSRLSKPNPPPGATPVDLPLITHLLTTYQSSPSSDGYPLARAVIGRHLPLIRLLLAFGADPAKMQAEAVMIAIRRGDLEVVRMLLERGRDEAISDDDEEEEAVGGNQKKKRRRSSNGAGGGAGKRRKLDLPLERIPATPAMIAMALQSKARGKRRPMVDYLTSRGAIPSIETFNLMVGPEWD